MDPDKLKWYLKQKEKTSATPSMGENVGKLKVQGNKLKLHHNLCLTKLNVTTIKIQGSYNCVKWVPCNPKQIYECPNPIMVSWLL